LPEAERSTFVRNAIAQGDVTVVHAVCSRLAGLSGLTEAMQKSLRQQAEEKFAPAAYANAQALAKLDAKLMQAGEAANKHRLDNLVNVTAKQSISLAAMNRLRGKKEAAK
jgi:hypothetical protein